jgi:hypothetical protein
MMNSRSRRMSTAVILGLAAGGLLAGVSETGGAAPAGLRPANAALLLLSRSSLKGNIQPVG